MPRCEARLVTPSARNITLRLASQRLALPSFRMDRLACSWRRFRLADFERVFEPQIIQTEVLTSKCCVKFDAGQKRLGFASCWFFFEREVNSASLSLWMTVLSSQEGTVDGIATVLPPSTNGKFV